MKTIFFLLLFTPVSVFAQCDLDRCDVTRFYGISDDDRIEAAINAAILTTHKVVYFPDGDYHLQNDIVINTPERAKLNFIGQSVKYTRLISAPILNDTGTCLAPTFNIDSVAGFDELTLKIERLTIDMSEGFNHPFYTQAGCSTGAHGIRVGNGWNTGSLTINEFVITGVQGYGIGIQNDKVGDISAPNVTITNGFILNTGQDGIDTKQAPDGGNTGLIVHDVTIGQIGFNDERSAAAIDVSYNNFDIRRVTIVTDAYRNNPLGTVENTGIRFRNRPTGSASYGVVHTTYIKGPKYGVFFEGSGASLNKNIAVKNFIVKEFNSVGIYLRGTGHTLKAGCSFSSKSPNGLIIDAANASGNTVEISTANIPQCPQPADIGSTYVVPDSPPPPPADEPPPTQTCQ